MKTKAPQKSLYQGFYTYFNLGIGRWFGIWTWFTSLFYTYSQIKFMVTRVNNHRPVHDL